MRKTILITGTSSGIGLATANYFAKNNWLVFATMRNTKHYVNNQVENIVPLELDVTDKQNIKNCIDFVLKKLPNLMSSLIMQDLEAMEHSNFRHLIKDKVCMLLIYLV